MLEKLACLVPNGREYDAVPAMAPIDRPGDYENARHKRLDANELARIAFPSIEVHLICPKDCHPYCERLPPRINFSELLALESGNSYEDRKPLRAIERNLRRP